PNPVAIPINSGQQTINLSGITAGPNDTQGLTVTASSDTPGLIPNPTVTYSSPNATGTLTYTPVAGQSGTATITVTLPDSGGTGNGGVDTIIRTFIVAVAPANQAPVVTATAAPLAYLQGQTVAIDGALTVTDADSLTLSGATVAIVSNFAPGQDVLAF